MKRLYKRSYSLASYVNETGASAIYKALVDNNVDHVFGYTGGAILPVHDALYNSDTIQYIKNVNEQCMGHAAEGYSKISNKPGVVISTSGPGITNLITVLQNAVSDGNPLVVLSGQVATTFIGTGAFQESPAVELAKNCTKKAMQITNVNDIPFAMKEAFEIAMGGRRGPVFIDLPKDILGQTIRKIHIPYYINDSNESNNLQVQQSRECAETKLDTLIALIKKATKPIIYAGQGACTSSTYIQALSKNLNIPVTTTIHGMGIMSESEPLSLQMLGMHGSICANHAIQQSDLILAIGCRFDDRTTGALPKYAPVAIQAGKENKGGIIHFNIDASEINRIVKSDLSFIGDCKEYIRRLSDKISTDETESIHTRNKKWVQHILNLKSKHPFTYTKVEKKLKVQEVAEKISELAPRAIITTGVGNHQMYMAQFYNWTLPSKMITSGSLGVMGFGLPSAIGAQLADRNAQVICFDGDGSFMMTGNDLATVKEYNLPLKIFIMNDSRQQMVYIWQKLFFNERYISTDNFNPDFNAYADAFGIDNLYCDDKDSMEAAVELALEFDGPIVVNCKVVPDMCTPLVAPGAALDDIMTGPPAGPIRGDAPC